MYFLQIIINIKQLYILLMCLILSSLQTSLKKKIPIKYYSAKVSQILIAHHTFDKARNFVSYLENLKIQSHSINFFIINVLKTLLTFWHKLPSWGPLIKGKVPSLLYKKERNICANCFVTQHDLFSKEQARIFNIKASFKKLKNVQTAKFLHKRVYLSKARADIFCYNRFKNFDHLLKICL